MQSLAPILDLPPDTSLAQKSLGTAYERRPTQLTITSHQPGLFRTACNPPILRPSLNPPVRNIRTHTSDMDKTFFPQLSASVRAIKDCICHTPIKDPGAALLKRMANGLVRKSSGRGLGVSGGRQSGGIGESWAGRRWELKVRRQAGLKGIR